VRGFKCDKCQDFYSGAACKCETEPEETTLFGIDFATWNFYSLGPGPTCPVVKDDIELDSEEEAK